MPRKIAGSRRSNPTGSGGMLRDSQCHPTRPIVVARGLAILVKASSYENKAPSTSGSQSRVNSG